MYTEHAGVSAGTTTRPDVAAEQSDFAGRDLTIGVLHLGPKTAILEKAGFRTIGDLENVSREQLVNVPGVGSRTADLLIQNRQALFQTRVHETGVNWDSYCQATGIPLLPRECRPASGDEFLACLPTFLEEVADHLPDETFAVILRERICQAPRHQKTLDEIASSTIPPVTRERIRQKEKKLLGQLTGGLLNDSYGGLDIHFRPEFSRWWKLAADSLSHREEVEFGEFVETLSASWKVPKDAVLSQLPVIIAIVTGEPQMNGDFRAASRIAPRLFGVLSDELLQLPVDRLRLGKNAGHLIDAGIATVGDIISRLRTGTFASAGGTAATVAAQHANLLASCLHDSGGVDWQSYRQANGLITLPDQPISGAAEFAAGLSATVGELLSASRVTKRAPDIYRLRTSRPVGSQMTLEAVAHELRTHPPTIKREETVFLRFLNDVLIGHNFSALPVWLDDRWLALWDEAKGTFRTSATNYSNFSDQLAWKWRLTAREMNKAAPTIWAVLTGYPDGRRSKGTVANLPILKEQPAPAPQIPSGRIRLRGFRRVH